MTVIEQITQLTKKHNFEKIQVKFIDSITSISPNICHADGVVNSASILKNIKMFVKRIELLKNFPQGHFFVNEFLVLPSNELIIWLRFKTIDEINQDKSYPSGQTDLYEKTIYEL